MKDPSVQGRINAAYYKLTASEKKVADFLMGHLAEAVSL